jgi:hypothetical protein
MPTPDDFRRLDLRLQRFWREHGETCDWVLIALLCALVAFLSGFLTGGATK